MLVNVSHSSSSDRPKCEGFCMLSFRFGQGQRDSTGEESDPQGCHFLQLQSLHFCYFKTYFSTVLFISWQIMLYMNIILFIYCKFTIYSIVYNKSNKKMV
jgi:hypothetical protein